jgi:hypothetical protein
MRASPLMTTMTTATMGRLRSKSFERISAPPPLHDDLAVVCAGALTTVHEARVPNDWAAPVIRDGRIMTKAEGFALAVDEVKELMKWRELNPFGYII